MTSYVSNDIRMCIFLIMIYSGTSSTLMYCTHDTCITLYCVYYLFEDCTYITFHCVYYLLSLSIIFCRHILPTCTNLSVIVIDKPIGLGGTVYTSTSIFV